VCHGHPVGTPSVNVTGNWVGTWAHQNPSNGSGDVRVSFPQNSEKLTGNFNVTDADPNQLYEKHGKQAAAAFAEPGRRDDARG
jgi:hypothetical protein